MINEIAGRGQHSHEVPTAINAVVEIRDGQHKGTAVWLRTDGTFVFASYDDDTIEYAHRCVLVSGLDGSVDHGVYGCDLDSPRGTFLVGVDRDDDLSWVPADAEIVWDSHAAAMIP